MIDVVTSLKFRLPYLWESLSGMNMAYYYAKHVPNNLLTSELRKCLKSGDVATIKAQIFKGLWELDDPLDIYSKHTLLHDSVIMNREDLFYFLLKQGANPMCRDCNGYTALLKAAALGRMDMVRALVEAGVDPRHIDPFGNTPREKAELYSHNEVVEYL